MNTHPFEHLLAKTLVLVHRNPPAIAMKFEKYFAVMYIVSGD